MIEVGKRYKTLEGYFTCIAVDDEFAYMQYDKGSTAYVWRLDGTAYNLAVPALAAERDYWKQDSAAAWDRCEERRLEQEALAARVAELEADCGKYFNAGARYMAEAADEVSRRVAAEAKLAERNAENARLWGVLTACAGVDHDCVAKMRIARAALEGKKK